MFGALSCFWQPLANSSRLSPAALDQPTSFPHTPSQCLKSTAHFADCRLNSPLPSLGTNVQACSHLALVCRWLHMAPVNSPPRSKLMFVHAHNSHWPATGCTWRRARHQLDQLNSSLRSKLTLMLLALTGAGPAAGCARFLHCPHCAGSWHHWPHCRHLLLRGLSPIAGWCVGMLWCAMCPCC